MKVMDILVKDAVILDLQSESKSDVIAEMAQALVAATPELELNELVEVLEAREKLQSTGIGEGIAIPHGKLNKIPCLMASFARSRSGVDFESIDGKPTHLLFLLVVPENSGGQHLKALARISRFFRDDEFRHRLEEASSADDVFKAIEDEDSKF